MLTTLRGRLMTGLVGLLFLVLLLATAAYLLLTIDYKRRDTYQQLRTTMYLVLRQLPANLVNALPQDRVEVMGKAAALLPDLVGTNYRLLVVRADGEVLLDSFSGKPSIQGRRIGLPPELLAVPPPTDPVPGVLDRDGAGNSYVYVVSPPRPRLQRPEIRRPNFYLVLAQRSPESEVIANFAGRFLLVGLVTLALAAVLAFLLARSITKPLAALQTATHQIAGGNYAHQAPVSGSVELQSLATDFNSMAAQVETTQRAQGDFLASVSHDLKTPLTAIQGFAQAMLDGVIREPPAYRDAAQIIHDEAGRMERLVADLLDLNRLQSGTTAPGRQAVDVAGLLRQAAGGVLPQAAEHGVELHVEAAAMPPLIGDPDLLHRALTNLLDNAVRHTPSGGQVTLGAKADLRGVLISVRDTGVGIPAADLPRIFERFYQVDKSRAAHGQGSGLGLAIVHQVVTAHGGQINVLSTPGAGSEFLLLLPAAPAAKP